MVSAGYVVFVHTVHGTPPPPNLNVFLVEGALPPDEEGSGLGLGEGEVGCCNDDS